MTFGDKIKAAIHGDIKEGAKLDTGIKLKENNPEHADVSLDNLTGKSVIVGVPGAFTPYVSPSSLSSTYSLQSRLYAASERNC